MRIDRIGDWKKVRSLSGGLKQTMQIAADPGFTYLALKGEGLMKRRIVEQPSDWPALSESYAKRKLQQ